MKYGGTFCPAADGETLGEWVIPADSKRTDNANHPMLTTGTAYQVTSNRSVRCLPST